MLDACNKASPKTGRNPLSAEVYNGCGEAGRIVEKSTMRFALCLMLIPALYAQGQRRVFSKIFTGEQYTIECYLPQITNGPNCPAWAPDGKELAFARKGSI